MPPMRKIAASLVLVTSAWQAVPAQANPPELADTSLADTSLADTSRADTCGSMLMPAAQLKQVARGFGRFHSGVDLLAPYGSVVRAAFAGRVVFAASYFAYGNIVDLLHADGTVTRYAHLSRFAPGIIPGAAVELGAALGAVGTSGNAHGAHLHFEVRIGGHAVDPKPFLALGACTITRPLDPIEEARAKDVVDARDRAR